MTTLPSAEKLERWSLERLVPYARNPRTHSAEQVRQIVASMREFGFTNPVLVDRSGEIIAGHGRVMAAKQLGLADVPVLVLGHLTEAQRRAYVIADNKIALNAGWDEELLAAELKALQLEGMDLELTGFDTAEIDKLFAEIAGENEGNTDKDEAPDAPERSVTQPGDLWHLGSHRLLCGDATKLESVERVLSGQLADMAFTDPPYNVDYGNSMPLGRGTARPMLNDNLGEGFSAFLRSACLNLLAVTKGAIYICMSSSELHTLQRAFVEAGGHWSTFIIWAKNHFTLGRADYQRQYEPILYGWREGTDHYWCGDRDQGDVWSINKPQANDLHPTMKPVELVERALRNSSKSRDTILDLFGGSGSTLIACETTGRLARLIELDPRYCDVIVRRWQEYTGLEATSGHDGQTFAQVMEARREPGAV